MTSFDERVGLVVWASLRGEDEADWWYQIDDATAAAHVRRFLSAVPDVAAAAPVAFGMGRARELADLRECS